jgi:Mce-associated membrane protein
VTLLVEKTEAPTVVEEPAPNSQAPWHIRAAALSVDVLPGVAVVATMALVWLAVPPRSMWWWVSVSILVGAALLTMANRVLFPAAIGWSMGRALFGIEVVGPDGSPAGVGRLMARELAHLVDTLSVFVGWLWPLWDPRGRTFADLLTHTEVQSAQLDRRPANIRPSIARVVAAGVLLCLAGAGMSVLAIILPDRASDRTRDAVNAEGPKIVAQILTYDAKSLKDDFARARSLTSDKYRPELIKQQESVQKGHPGVNEYWVTDSTVLSATPNRATMLLFMQGHRGGGDQQRFITATVQVSFVEGNHGNWLVDDLSVVTKPKPAQGKK